jgi:putative ABC transport system ATP-binding protein
VLLAGKPTGNLDETTRDEIITLLSKLVRDRGLTLVIATPDSAVAACPAHRPDATAACSSTAPQPRGDQ